jgi:hypothetical protein
MLIVLPSIVSGIGVAFLLAGIFIDQSILRPLFVSIGALLLWLDFFITMAIFRFTVRDIDRRLGAIEDHVSDG